MKKQVGFVAMALVLALPLSLQAAAGKCPSKAAAKEALKKTFNRNLEVTKVSESAVKGLCEVLVRLGGQTRIVYTDSGAKYILAGQIYRASDRANITKERMAELNRFTQAEMKTLDSLVAFTVGSGKKTFYLVTDPMCPFCKRAEKIIDPLIKEGKIRVKFLLFPLRFHKGAKEKCISIICDKKGYEGFKTGYQSKNQCEQGKNKVESTIKFLQSKGITGTPTYIFEDGRYHSGVMQKDALLKRLGI